MTMRTRQVVVAAGLILLVVYVLAAWMGSGAPTPSPSIGPSPTGAIGPGPATFVPSEEPSPLP
jgi:hypothetical protein